jgi:hypothetical protein
MLDTEDNEQVTRHVAMLKAVEKRAVDLEKQEAEMVLTRLAREAEAEWQGVDNDGMHMHEKTKRPFYWACCRMQCCRRRLLSGQVSKQRKEARKKLTSDAIVDTLPRHKKERLLEERKMQESLGGVRGLLFGSLFGIDKSPEEVGEDNTTMDAVALFLCWLYVGVLTYFTLAMMMVMDQRAAIECMTMWIFAFFTQNVFTQPILIAITTVYLPILLIKLIVEPELAARASIELGGDGETSNDLDGTSEGPAKKDPM